MFDADAEVDHGVKTSVKCSSGAIKHSYQLCEKESVHKSDCFRSSLKKCPGSEQSVVWSENDDEDDDEDDDDDDEDDVQSVSGRH